MKKLTLTKTTILASFSACLFATVSCSTDEDPTAVVQEQQTTSLKKTDASRPYTYVEQMPEFKGNENALLSFLGSNIRYPEAAEKAGIEGLTVLTFVIETDGSVTNVQTVKSLSPEIDQEAARVIKLTSGNWNPGKQDGEPVRVKYTIPVRFALK
ncbi:energy transducer TonB [Pontibacter pamirensis]|uniref:energy transducer TonB n=1 Tax=Pontibacter pamirensis TaxID=2562824 RepID=UPI00138973F6|nr:energy transducer TonB [Pontibacter pamirensis]